MGFEMISRMFFLVVALGLGLEKDTLSLFISQLEGGSTRCKVVVGLRQSSLYSFQDKYRVFVISWGCYYSLYKHFYAIFNVQIPIVL